MTFMPTPIPENRYYRPGARPPSNGPLFLVLPRGQGMRRFAPR